MRRTSVGRVEIGASDVPTSAAFLTRGGRLEMSAWFHT